MGPTNPEFSVLMPVYAGDNPEHFRIALESVFDQTLPPTELVIVEDGPLPPELKDIIQEIKERGATVHIVSLPENRGLGEALQVGVQACTHNLVARMDADDIAVNDRFERQVEYLKQHEEIDVLGGHAAEFNENPEQTTTVRKVPTTPDEVRSKAKLRCPVNHPTVMFRRDAVLEAGNYRSYRSMQDYELWTRMLSQGYEISNLDEVLVRFRTDGSLYERRGGVQYAKTELNVLYDIYQNGAVSLPMLLLNIGFRIPVRLLPGSVRTRIYRDFLRE